jgi:HD-GYP domain-containing protein (c-di-GMP phosphodiesterase class II)
LISGDSFWFGLFGPVLDELRSAGSRLRETRQAMLLPFAERFAEIMDSRFEFMDGVSGRVALLSEALGRSVGMGEQRLQLLRIAALLHDIGQLGVPERIMAKPGILSVEELDLLRQHPIDSHDILKEIPGLEDVAEWVCCHHEWPNGRGYPEGKAGHEIPLEARILAIVDFYVSVTSDRPHRPRMEPKAGIVRLRSAAGTQLDRELLEVFIERVAIQVEN